MKIEPSRFASLSSGLLARKGAARPAMRPQGFNPIGGAPDDLGWNDMGYDPPRPALVPVRDERHDAFGEELPAPVLRNPLAALTPASPVHSQHAELAERLSRDQDNTDSADPADYDEDGEEIDETAELYDPAASDDGGMAAEDSTGDDSAEPALELETPEVVPLAAIVPLIRPALMPAAPRGRQAPRTAKAAFTLRLDPQRHLRLRLASAVTGRSAQQLLTEALDELLASMPDLDSLAEQAPTAGKRVNRKG